MYDDVGFPWRKTATASVPLVWVVSIYAIRESRILMCARVKGKSAEMLSSGGLAIIAGSV